MIALQYVEVTSGVSAFTGAGFCTIEAKLSDGKRFVGQMAPAEVRQMALGWLQAAEAAEHDAAVFAELKESAGADSDVAGQFILALRARRGA